MSASLAAVLHLSLSAESRRSLRRLRNSRALGLAKAALWGLRGEPSWLSRDRATGGWVHRYRRGVLVTPQPVALSWRQVEAIAHDVFFRHYLPTPGDTVVEVGAGCGSETVTVARLVGGAGRVIAVEAHPWTYELLGRTCEENRLANVTLVPVAIADQPGVLSISDMHPTLNQANRIVAAGAGIEVPAVTLDELIEAHELTRIDLLKMNIEGAERLALAGLSRRTSDRIRNVVIGCHDFLADESGDESYRTKAHVRALLVSLGFTVIDAVDSRPWAADYVYATRV